MMFHILLYLFSFDISFVSTDSKHEKLLVVSYDGFRYDYLDLYKNITPALNALKSSSSYAKCLINVFPTQTFPNHFSLATGVYTEVHGVLGSKVFDKDSERTLTYGNDLFHYYDKITPIWTLNENAGDNRHSGVIMWPGSDFEYNKTNATFRMVYDSKVPFESRVATAMSWFKHPVTPANFIMMYFQEPDATSHAFGPYSHQNQEQIIRVDKTTQYILDSLKNNKLTDVNVIFLSDHGMEPVILSRIIDLKLLVGDKADFYGTSPVLQVYPKTEYSVTDVYDKLKAAAEKNKNFKVFLKEDIPEHFHLKKCRRAPPILAVAEPTYAFQDLYDTINYFVKKYNASNNGTYGVHGYDPLTVNMHPYFIAHGPLFKENYNAGDLRSVDMFSLFAHILQLEGPKDYRLNGTFSGVDKLLKSGAENVVLHVIIIGGAVLCLVAIILTYMCCYHKQKKDVELLEDVEVEKLLNTTNA